MVFDPTAALLPAAPPSTRARSQPTQLLNHIHPTHPPQVPETLPAEILAKMGAPPKADDPVITADDLKEYDGFLFGALLLG